MNGFTRIMATKFTYLTLILLLLISCHQTKQKTVFEKAAQSPKELQQHALNYASPKIIAVTENIHVAMGYGLANSILIEGEQGNIIVDCMESNEAAQRVKNEFEQISTKPTKAIIYTHNHADHIFGAGVMAGEDKPAIYAHELTNYYINRLLNVVLKSTKVRSYRMLGVQLDEASHAGCGIGPFFDANENTTRSLLRPTHTFKDSLTLEIEGVKLKLVHAPGETNDQLFVWLPEQKILLPGDNIYKAFPNLYTIRGTPYRDVITWAASLDKMRYLKPEILLPSHTEPIIGKNKIEGILKDYADAIRFVHDQTIRYMNKGFTTAEIAERVVLPPHLSQSDYLQEFYGRVDWSVKNVFNGYLGWFDGNATTLLPLTISEKARRIAELAGSEAALLQKTKQALKDQQHQWTLELTDYLRALDFETAQVKEIRYQCLTVLGEKQSNPNARNYYLSQALELKGESMVPKMETPISVIETIPIEAIFNTLSVSLKAEQCLDYQKSVEFQFTDTQQTFTLMIRKGILEIQSFGVDDSDILVITDTDTWRALSTNLIKPTSALTKGKLKIKGGLLSFKQFMDMFEDNQR